MKEVRTMGAQGDVLFRRVDAIPSDFLPEAQQETLVVAHSESGHHHVITAPDVRLYTNADPFRCFLRIDGEHADVEHLRPYETHETLRLLGGGGRPTFYEVRRQREYAPERDPRSGSFRRVAD